MRRLPWIVLGVTCILANTPTGSKAQVKEQAEDFVEDVLMALFGPNLNLFLQGGVSSSGRFVLQSLEGPVSGQRALRGDDGFNLGGGVGVDVLLRLGFRFSYTYTDSDLVFRTDNGNGSEVLDVDDLGGLHSHVAGIEMLHYMLPSRVSLTPYASAGVVGVWWVLSEGSSFVAPGGSSTQFRLGALASVGLQAKVHDHLAVRVEGDWASVSNPFTGNESFRVTGGTIVDEPTRVSKNDFRLGLVYHFSRPDLPDPLQTRVR